MSNDPSALLVTRARKPGGFSLIEVMIAGALLGLIGAGVLTSITFASREAARTRARTYASSDAQTVIDRILVLIGVARAAAGDDAVICGVLMAAGGPMDPTGGTLTVNSCPSLTVTDVPLPRSSLKRTVVVTPALLGVKNALKITVRISGGQLPDPGFIQIESHVIR